MATKHVSQTVERARRARHLNRRRCERAEGHRIFASVRVRNSFLRLAIRLNTNVMPHVTCATEPRQTSPTCRRTASLLLAGSAHPTSAALGTLRTLVAPAPVSQINDRFWASI